MIIETLQTAAFPKDYCQISQVNGTDKLFSNQIWYDNFLETVVSPQDSVYWIGCKASTGEPLLLFPLWQQRNNSHLSTRLAGLANYYTTLYEPIHCITDQSSLVQAIELAVKAICQLKWDIIDLYPLNPLSVSYPLLIQAFKRQYKFVTPYFMYGNWFLLTQGQAFKDYFAGRPGQLRNTIKRKANKLIKEKSVEYRICTQPEEVAFAVQLFQQIYQASWKQDEPYPNFIPGLAKAAAEHGWLRLGLLFIDQQASAAQLWLTLGQTAYIYKLCQDPVFDSYSPGSLLTVHLMEYVMDMDKVTKVDFLTGDDAYKKDWMSQREERWGLQIANPNTFYGFMQLSKNFIGRHVKKVIAYFKSI